MKRLTKSEYIDLQTLDYYNTIVIEYPLRLKPLREIVSYFKHPSDPNRWQKLEFTNDEIKSSGFNLKSKDLVSFVNNINLEKGVKITLR